MIYQLTLYLPIYITIYLSSESESESESESDEDIDIDKTPIGTTYPIKKVRSNSMPEIGTSNENSTQKKMNTQNVGKDNQIG